LTLLTIKEAAGCIGIRIDSLRQLADRGSIPCWRIPSEASPRGERRFDQTEVELYKALRAERLRLAATKAVISPTHPEEAA
jgi:hypothetical protein